jgi:putative addiction module CopG family antidote
MWPFGNVFPVEVWPVTVSLSDELKAFIRKKIENGQYPSEAAVIEAALKRLRDHEQDGRQTMPALDDLVDQEFVEYCAREADDGVTLEEVLDATSTIKDSMARVIIDEERMDRF